MAWLIVLGATWAIARQGYPLAALATLVGGVAGVSWLDRWSTSATADAHGMHNLPPPDVWSQLWRSTQTWERELRWCSAWTSAYRSDATEAVLYRARGLEPPAHTDHARGAALDLIPAGTTGWGTLLEEAQRGLAEGWARQVIDERSSAEPHIHVVFA